MRSDKKKFKLNVAKTSTARPRVHHKRKKRPNPAFGEAFILKSSDLEKSAAILDVVSALFRYVAICKPDLIPGIGKPVLKETDTIQ